MQEGKSIQDKYNIIKEKPKKICKKFTVDEKKNKRNQIEEEAGEVPQEDCKTNGKQTALVSKQTNISIRKH